MQNYTKYREQNEKDRQTNESFDKVNKKSLQDILIDKIENEYGNVIILKSVGMKHRKNFFMLAGLTVRQVNKKVHKKICIFFISDKIDLNLKLL